MTELEKEIEAKLVRMVKAQGGLCLKWVCPGWSGVPDRVILLPGGRAIFAELKRPRGSKTTELQKWWARKLQGLGFPHFFVYSTTDVARLQQYIIMGAWAE